jgi:HlyD family secretion protein
MSKTRTAIATIAAASAAAGGLWFYQRADASELPAYRTAHVERGSLQSTVAATGALSAVRTVQVGTQVSGQVSALYVDYNDKVRKGQLLARIDPTLQQQAVQDAQAQLERAQAQLDQARREYERSRQLFDAKVVTESEFVGVQSNYRVAQADVKSAQVSLERARQNLSYTAIYAPIDGVVVERNVDVGQTVAASLSAPQLFLIANDLSEMQILASVDESDIGKIAEGQRVTFTVSAHPNDRFAGIVRQVRLQSATTENVVNYTAVVSVENPQGKLLPGMTATVQFLTSAAADVLTVPNAALRFRPATAGTATGAATGASASGASGASGAAATGARRTRPATGARTATLWSLDANGQPTPRRVTTGLSDGQRTQVAGAGLAEGQQVIVGTAATAGAPATGGAASPFQQQQQGGGPRPPGGF